MTNVWQIDKLTNFNSKLSYSYKNSYWLVIVIIQLLIKHQHHSPVSFIEGSKSRRMSNTRIPNADITNTKYQYRVLNFIALDDQFKINYP